MGLSETSCHMSEPEEVEEVDLSVDNAVCYSPQSPPVSPTIPMNECDPAVINKEIVFDRVSTPLKGALKLSARVDDAHQTATKGRKYQSPPPPPRMSTPQSGDSVNAFVSPLGENTSAHDRVVYQGLQTAEKARRMLDATASKADLPAKVEVLKRLAST